MTSWLLLLFDAAEPDLDPAITSSQIKTILLSQTLTKA